MNNQDPSVVARSAQPYVGVTERIPPEQLSAAIDRGLASVFGWLAAQSSVAAAGAPFIRYIEVDMADSLLVELAVPVDRPATADGPIRAATLPGGDYATLLYRGRYDGLVQANADLQEWGERHGLTWAMDGPLAWRARLEHYLTDPRQEPDPSRWETEVAYLIYPAPRRPG